MQRRESRKRGASVAPESEKTRRYPVVSTKTGHRPACFLSLLARTSGNVARRDCVLESRVGIFYKRSTLDLRPISTHRLHAHRHDQKAEGHDLTLCGLLPW